jgi:hypothetical protein
MAWDMAYLHTSSAISSMKPSSSNPHIIPLLKEVVKSRAPPQQSIYPELPQVGFQASPNLKI